MPGDEEKWVGIFFPVASSWKLMEGGWAQQQV